MSESTRLPQQSMVAGRDEQITLTRTTGRDGLAALANVSYDYDRVDERGLHLRDYLHTLRKHMWLVLGVTVLIPTLVAIYLIRKPDVFEAQARVQVDLENGNSLLGGMSKNSSVILNGDSTDPAYFNTQLQILTGPGLLRKVVKNLDLEHNPEFAGDHSSSNTSMWSRLRGLLGFKSKAESKNPASDTVPVSSTSPSATQELAEAERLSDYVEALQGTLSVEPVKETRLSVRETRLIDISCRLTDPRMAAKVVNTIADTFESQNLEKKTKTSSSTGSYLDKRIADLQATIRSKEEELINYGKNHQILSLDANQNTVVERLAGLSKQLLEAEKERELAESAYRASLQPGAAEALAEGNEKSVLSAATLNTDAEIKLAELKQKRAELLVENTEKWPAVKEIDRQIAEREKQMNDTRARGARVVTTNLGTRYREALATEQSLRKAYDQQRGETLTQNEAAVNYRIIQQEIETNKTLLDGLLQRTKENDVVMAGTPNNVRVVDYAIAPKKAVSPKRTFIIGLTLLASLGCGIGLAFLLEYLNDSVRSTEDVENFLHLPSVALIPLVGQTKRKRQLGFGSKNGAPTGNNGNGFNGRDVLLTDIDKRSPLAEAYRHLRTSILLSTAGRPPRTLLITSSVPSEGKTTTAVNTAISLAQTGARVLMIDADMRRPRLHSIFNLNNGVGLSSLLSREVDENEINTAIQHEERSGIFILTAGPVPPNPAELVGSDQMLRLISMITPKYAHVVIDSPPIAAFTDGVLIATMVDGVLLVVHSGKNSRKVVARARKLLRDVGARMIGVVLNKVEAAPENSYYYYSGHYDHYNDGSENQIDSAAVGT
jgi:polysaccharide biosynthesis transport protein